MSEERKVALITGITGQDGSYLTELLLSKGYTVSVLICTVEYLFDVIDEQIRTLSSHSDSNQTLWNTIDREEGTHHLLQWHHKING